MGNVVGDEKAAAETGSAPAVVPAVPAPGDSVADLQVLDGDRARINEQATKSIVSRSAYGPRR